MNTLKHNHPPVLDRIAPNTDQRFREAANRNNEIFAPDTERFQESIENIGRKYAGVRDALIGTTKGYARTTHKYVSRNPWMAMGIAGGVAFLAGIFLGRRR